MGKVLVRWLRSRVLLAATTVFASVALLGWSLLTTTTPIAPEEVAARGESSRRAAGELPSWHPALGFDATPVAFAFAERADPMMITADWSGPSPHTAVDLGHKEPANRETRNPTRVAAADQPAKPHEEKKEEKEEANHKAEAGPATYVGSAKCMSCHISQGETFAKTTMGRIFLKNPRSQHEKLGCEACHGPGSVHVAKGGAEDDGFESIFTFDADSPRSIPERNARCLTCHESGMRTHWKGSPHETRNLACTSCHQIMDKASPRNQLIKATETETCLQCHKDRKAQLWRSSHMPVREGKLNCTSCHNPHGTPNQKLLKEATVNETCYTCHADKRGPFLFEHAPARDNCLNCHEPHGSIHEKLLTVSRPRLCQQCHSEEDHPSEPHGPRELFAFNRGCANCHGGMQHGSNSPSGAQLHR